MPTPACKILQNGESDDFSSLSKRFPAFSILTGLGSMDGFLLSQRSRDFWALIKRCGPQKGSPGIEENPAGCILLPLIKPSQPRNFILVARQVSETMADKLREGGIQFVD